MKFEKIIQQVLEWTHHEKEVYRLSVEKEEIYRHTACRLMEADIVVHRLDELNRFKLEDLYAHAQHI